MEQEQPGERETRDDGRRGRDPPLLPPCRWLGRGPRRSPVMNVIVSCRDGDCRHPLCSPARCFGLLVSSFGDF